MKKKIILLIFICSIILVGCTTDLNNTPSKRVDYLFSNYQELNDKLIDSMSNLIDDYSSMNDEVRNEYKEVFKRQYKDLKYEIKDEIIDGNLSTVTVEIEVYDLNKVNMESDDYYKNNQDEFVDENNNIDSNKYTSYKVDRLMKTNDRITYTLDINLKNIDGKWKIDDLSDEDISKIHGLYNSY